MQGIRKILRALGIVVSAALGCWLLIDAVVRGPGEYQLLISAAMLAVAGGLAITWFWSPFG